MHSSTTERLRAWLVIVVAFIATALTPSPANAEPDAFKSSYSAGRTALQEGAFQEALDRFRESMRDAGTHQAASWKGMIGVAYAFRGLEQPGYSLEYYRRFLDASALHEKMLPPKWRARREAVQAEVEELESQALETHALVSVTSKPEGATLMVDGLRAGADGQAVTPYPIYLKPGEHSLTVSMSGYEDMTTSITLSAGELVPLSVTLVRIPAAPAESTTAPTPSQPSITEPVVKEPTPVAATRAEQGITPVSKTLEVGEAPSMIGPYTMIGVGAATALAAVGLTVAASAENTALEDRTRELNSLTKAEKEALTGKQAQDHVNELTSMAEARDSLEQTSAILYGVGIVVAVSGIVWMAFAEGDDADGENAAQGAPMLGIMPTNGGAMTSATWRV